jgi:hypothetical protein
MLGGVSRPQLVDQDETWILSSQVLAREACTGGHNYSAKPNDSLGNCMKSIFVAGNDGGELAL